MSVLAVWRVTHLLQAEDGPFDLVFKVRKFVGNGFFGSLMDCFYCLSLWVALPLAMYLGRTWMERVLLWLALSSGAIIIQRLIHRDEHRKGEQS